MVIVESRCDVCNRSSKEDGVTMIFEKDGEICTDCYNKRFDMGEEDNDFNPIRKAAMGI